MPIKSMLKITMVLLYFPNKIIQVKNWLKTVMKTLVLQPIFVNRMFQLSITGIKDKCDYFNIFLLISVLSL